MAQPRSEVLETETVFTIVSNATTRAVLRYLRRAQQATARELARYLTSSSRTGGATDVGYRSRRDAITALVHNHLPRLAAHGVVEYDDPTDEVTLGPSFDDVEPFVDLAGSAETE